MTIKVKRQFIIEVDSKMNLPGVESLEDIGVGQKIHLQVDSGALVVTDVDFRLGKNQGQQTQVIRARTTSISLQKLD